jgi:hypothetical protein
MKDDELEVALTDSLEKSFNDNELDNIMNEIESLEKEFSGEVKKDNTHLSLQTAVDNSLQDIIDAEVANIEEAAAKKETLMEEAVAEAVEELFVAESPEVVEELVAAESPEVDPDDVIAQQEAQSAESVLAEQKAAMQELGLEAPGPVANLFEEEVAEAVEEAVVAQEPVAEESMMVEEPVAEEDEAPAFTAEELAEIEASTMEEEGGEVVAFNSASTPAAGGDVKFNASGSMNLNVTFEVAGEEATLKVAGGGLVVEMNGVHIKINEEDGCSVVMDGGINFSVPLAGKKAA